MVLHFIKVFFALAMITGFLFVAGGIGHDSIDMVITGGMYSLLSGLVLSFLHAAKL